MSDHAPPAHKVPQAAAKTQGGGRKDSLAAGDLGATSRLLNASPKAGALRALGHRLSAATPAQRRPAPPANATGLPDRLKAGVEALSGLALDDVRVHRNSPHAARLQAHAFAQGSDIHLGPGQERHLPHEAWHVVQQKQGRVRATRQMKAGVPLNDDIGLEREADTMGARAAGLRLPAPTPDGPPDHHAPIESAAAAVQRKVFLHNQESPLQPIAYHGLANPLDHRITPAGLEVLRGWLTDNVSREYRDEAAVIEAANEAGEVAPQVHAPHQQVIGNQRVVQGRIFFLNVAKAFAEKANAVLNVFNRHAKIVDFIGARDCAIELVLSDDNPASVVARKRTVQIELATWYFENYSVPEIVGMLNHEFGIHPVADHELGEGHGKQRVGHVQVDHIMGTATGSPRNVVYMDVVLQSALLLQKPADAHKSLYVYLMDAATIASTADKRQDAWKSPELTKQAYIAARNGLIVQINKAYPSQTHPKENKFLLAVLPTVGDFALTKDFIGAGVSLLSSRKSTKSIAPNKGGGGNSNN